MPSDDNVLRSQTNRHQLPQIISLAAGDLFYSIPCAAPRSLKVWQRRTLQASRLEASISRLQADLYATFARFSNQWTALGNESCC
ncbi:hypothetical protein E2553_31660 [Paraburkholderia dipogonis]|uniref:Uncharacterized protein n=1 Tax=Paraburkholderia dipogonis TaxID=1211383 RepID=A0A4Y8MUL1_9BURK|nr:hypothetical protein [Paraburkholderia dipogonis]TFE41240.1 hypothetical protein E2553_31660 [Paraburkholderia dipogonis]